jgi:hypothetical protein
MVEKPSSKYGFEQSDKSYTIRTFGEMSKKFKAQFLNGRVMTPQEVETEFWRLVTHPTAEEREL